MSGANPLEWADFYKELAKTLLQYKGYRQELAAKVKKVFKTAGVNPPAFKRGKQIVDIDPFTVFALFNRASIKMSNRVKLACAIAELFDITSAVPASFEGVPVLNNQNLNNQNAAFYYFADISSKTDIDDLWNLFEAALAYANTPSSENRSRLSKYFDININKKGNGNSKITMAMYWIAPNAFLVLDEPNIWYIYKSGRLPLELVQTFSAMKEKISSVKYFDILEKLRAYLQSNASALKDFKELNFEAQRRFKEVNKNNYPRYHAEKFLEEVYMDRESYNTLAALVKNKKNVILQGAPGVGKTYAAKRLAYSIMGVKDKERVMMVQFHQSYSYEDFIMGFRPSGNGFELKQGVFYNFCKLAEFHKNHDYFFIIDEINRGNLSKIFGELFMLIEKDKRGMELQLLYSDEKFSVPDNVYIIGMMNTADRSLAMLDYALRRRFVFYEMKPGFETEGFQKYQKSLNSEKFNNLIRCVKNLNTVIAADETLGEGFLIGHSYFCSLKEASSQALSEIVEFELIPLLKEYWFDEPAKAKDWSSRLKNVII